MLFFSKKALKRNSIIPKNVRASQLVLNEPGEIWGGGGGGGEGGMGDQVYHTTSSCDVAEMRGASGGRLG